MHGYNDSTSIIIIIIQTSVYNYIIMHVAMYKYLKHNVYM